MKRRVQTGSLYDMASSRVEAVHDLVSGGGKWKKERIHAVRLAIRRLNGAMELCHFEGVPVLIPDAFRKAFKKLGNARDLDRTIALLGHHRTSDAKKSVISHLKKKRDKYRKKLSYNKFCESIENTCCSLQGELLHARKLEPKNLPDFNSLLTRHIISKEDIDDLSRYAPISDLDDKSLHKRRIQIKKMRYLLEPVPDVPADILHRLHRLQSYLGDLHDIQVARKLAAKNGAGINVDRLLAGEAQTLRKQAM